MTKQFYDDKYLKEYQTVIKDTFEQDGKFFVSLEDYIFYPQGGGQKGDKGKLIIDNKEYLIINTIKNFNDHNDILLIVDKLIDKADIGKEVYCILDWEYRYKQMRLHTAMHLYHYSLEKISNKEIVYPDISSIEDGFGFNKYQQDAFDISIINDVNVEFLKLIASDTKVVTYPDDNDSNYRWWNILDYKIPCGGIHVDQLNQIGDVSIKVTNKKGYITIKIILES